MSVKKISGEPVVEGDFRSIPELLRCVLKASPMTRHLKFVVADKVVNEHLIQQSGAGSKKTLLQYQQMSVVRVGGGIRAAARIRTQIDVDEHTSRVYMTDRSWTAFVPISRRMRSKRKQACRTLPRYLYESLTKQRNIPDRAWGMSMPKKYMCPAFCQQCHAIISEFGARLREWKQEGDHTWTCDECQGSKPLFNCGLCEFPMWAEDTENTNCCPQDDDEVWCPDCSVRFSSCFSGA